jgi:hypothetical protein
MGDFVFGRWEEGVPGVGHCAPDGTHLYHVVGREKSNQSCFEAMCALCESGSPCRSQSASKNPRARTSPHSMVFEPSKDEGYCPYVWQKTARLRLEGDDRHRRELPGEREIVSSLGLRI